MNAIKATWMLSAFAVWPALLAAQTPAEDYAQSCAMCHTIGGGPLAGPDLAGMSDRRERSWLIRFIVDPQAVIDSGDDAAQAMVDEYKGMVMPALPGHDARARRGAGRLCARAVQRRSRRIGRRPRARAGALHG